MAWTQSDLNTLAIELGQPSVPTPPVLIEDLLAEIAEPQWLRTMDPRDRQWLDAVEAPLRAWDD